MSGVSRISSRTSLGSSMGNLSTLFTKPSVFLSFFLSFVAIFLFGGGDSISFKSR